MKILPRKHGINNLNSNEAASLGEVHDNNISCGYKRKLPDAMVIDDNVVYYSGIKKSKCVVTLIHGSGETSVEAEVGQTQPRRVL